MLELGLGSSLVLDLGLRCVQIFTVRSVNSGLREYSWNITSCICGITKYRKELQRTTKEHNTGLQGAAKSCKGF